MTIIADRVKVIVSAELGVGTVAVSDRLDRDLGADSHDRQSLTLALEDAFGFEIPDRESQHFVTVGDVITFIERHIQKLAAST